MKEKLAICGGTPIRTEPLTNSPRTLGDNVSEYVMQLLESRHLNRMGGTWVVRLEKEFAEFYGAQYCTASTSGTAAIHLAVGALNPEPGDEIITSPITDMGTIIPILAQNAIPVFADVEPDTGNVDPADVANRVTSRTRAILPVHLGGNPCNMQALVSIAQRHNLMLIEDCSQAYCATVNGQRVGTLGDIGCFSMQQSKHLTAGDGGLTITDDAELGEKVKLFADKGWPRYSADGARDYKSFGFNYRMTELQGAVAVSALSALESVVDRRRRNAERLTALLKEVRGIYPQRVAPGAQSVYWSYFARAEPEEAGASAEDIAAAVRAEGIPCGYQYIGKPIFLYEAIRRKRIYGESDFPFNLQPPSHVQEFVEGECPNCERFLNQLLNVPIHEDYTDKEVEDIALAFRKVIENVDAIAS